MKTLIDLLIDAGSTKSQAKTWAGQLRSDDWQVRLVRKTLVKKGIAKWIDTAPDGSPDPGITISGVWI